MKPLTGVSRSVLVRRQPQCKINTTVSAPMNKLQAVVLAFLKVPEAGRVKTRLAQSIGSAEAARIYRDMAGAQLYRVPEAFDLEIHFDPPSQERAMRQWLGPTFSLFPQTEGDLGARLASATAAAFHRHDRPVICIGGDCPGLDREVLLCCADALNGDADCVLGPSLDGGYYLIGLRQPYAALFANIPWSSQRTLAATENRAAEVGLRVSRLKTLRDVDTVADLRAEQTSGRLHCGV